MRNLMETLRIGKSVELLWRESTSMDFDEEYRLEMFNKSIKKRLELIHEKAEASSRVIEEKVIRSKRNYPSDQLLIGSGRSDLGFDRYNSGKDEEDIKGVWDTEEFGDMDQFEKMMLMKSFKKKKEPQKSLNSRYNENYDEEGEDQEMANAMSDYVKGFNPKMRAKRRKESITLIKIISRLVLNMIKHQSKRNEIGSGSLKKHKDIGYQMLRKTMKGFEQEVNREDEVELFIERFCPEDVTMILDEFKEGKKNNSKKMKIN
jgi:hypothetical protein